MLLTPTELRTPADDSRGPYGVKTVLGWYVFGPVEADSGSDSGRHVASFLRMTEVSRRSEESVRVIEFQKLYDQDFRDLHDEGESLSVEERDWLTEVKSTVRKDEAGHFEIGLPRGEIGAGASPILYFFCAIRR